MQAPCDRCVHFKNLQTLQWNRNIFILNALCQTMMWLHKTLIVSLAAVSVLRSLPSFHSVGICDILTHGVIFFLLLSPQSLSLGTQQQQQRGSAEASRASHCLGYTRRFTEGASGAAAPLWVTLSVWIVPLCSPETKQSCVVRDNPLHNKECAKLLRCTPIC